MVAIIEEPDSPETLRHLLDAAMLEAQLRPNPENRAAVEEARRALDNVADHMGQETAGTWRGFGKD